MPRIPLFVVAAPLLACASCSFTGIFEKSSELDPKTLQSLGDPPIERAVRAYEPSVAREIDLDALVSSCRKSNVVFLGETHTDETTHRFQLYMLMRLAAAKDGKVVLAMEQFERDVQKPLDDYLSGAIDEKTFKSRTPSLWSNYDPDYRPLVEFAKANHIPVIASNAATSVRRKLATGGRKAFEALNEEERGYVAREMLPETDAYWKRVADATAGHAAMGMGGPSTPEEMLFSGQSVWDNTMAESIARAHERWADRIVLHVNGGFHSEYFDGTVAQLKKRAPDLVVKTLAIDSVDDLALAPVPTDAGQASFIVHAANVAQSEHDDLYTVRIARDEKYRFSRPHGVATPPLLVVLPGRGVATAEVESLMRSKFGNEVAIAVLEPMYPLPPGASEDFGESGAFFAGKFESDLGAGTSAARATTEYLLRRFSLDAKHVVVLGFDDGARLAIGCGLDSDFPLTSFIALEPGSPKRLAEIGAGRPIPGRSMRVLCDPKQLELWNAEVKRHAESKIDATAVAIATDPWQRDEVADDAIRQALGLSKKAKGGDRRHLALAVDTPRSRLWAAQYAMRAAPDSSCAILTPSESSAHEADLASSTALDVTIHAEAFKQAHALPTAPGSFGGTTVVVVPATADAAERDAWLALETDDPINKASRFHRLRVATADGDHALPLVLDKLKSEGRKNLLVVPAVFCADGATMHELEGTIGDRALDFTIAYSPGLGGRLPAPKQP